MTALVLLFVGSGLLLCALSIPMVLRKVPPNRWYGVRLAGTRNDESLWYEVNAFGGKCLLAAGLIWSVSALALALVPGMDVDTYSILMLVVLSVTFIPAVALIVRQLRQTSRKEAQRPG